MNLKKENEKCFEILDQKSCSLIENQRIQFQKETEELLNKYSANGMTGNAIVSVVELCINLYKERENFLIENLSNLPFSYSEGLKNYIYKLTDKLFSRDFGEFKKSLDSVILRAGGGAPDSPVGYEAYKLLGEGVESIAASLDANIQHQLLLLRSSNSTSNADKILVFIGIACLLAAVYLAGMWTIDSSGNYEPWIVILTVAFTIIEVIRRSKSG